MLMSHSPEFHGGRLSVEALIHLAAGLCKSGRAQYLSKLSLRLLSRLNHSQYVILLEEVADIDLDEVMPDIEVCERSFADGVSAVDQQYSREVIDDVLDIFCARDEQSCTRPPAAVSDDVCLSKTSEHSNKRTPSSGTKCFLAEEVILGILTFWLTILCCTFFPYLAK